MRPPAVIPILPFTSLFVTALLSLPTLFPAHARTTPHPATSAPALAYAATTGCTVASLPGICFPDACFAAGGRCKSRPGNRQICYSHILVNGVEELRQWSRERTGRGTRLELKACSGCRCMKHREGPRKARLGPVQVRVWGMSGGVVEGTQRRGEWDGRGEGEECLIVGRAGCDAEACFEHGGRCRVDEGFKARCVPNVLNVLGNPGVVKNWVEGNAGGMCVGCVCQGVTVGVWKGRKIRTGRREGEGEGERKKGNVAQVDGNTEKPKKEGEGEARKRAGNGVQVNGNTGKRKKVEEGEAKQKEGDTAKRKDNQMEYLDFLRFDGFDHLEEALPGSL